MLSKWSFSFIFYPPQLRLHFFPIRSTRPTLLIIHDFITQTITGDEWRSWSASSRNFLYSRVTTSLLTPNTACGTLFSNILSQCSEQHHANDLLLLQPRDIPSLTNSSLLSAYTTTHAFRFFFPYMEKWNEKRGLWYSPLICQCQPCPTLRPTLPPNVISTSLILWRLSSKTLILSSAHIQNSKPHVHFPLLMSFQSTRISKSETSDSTSLTCSSFKVNCLTIAQPLRRRAKSYRLPVPIY
jgi:hypothetical protein